MTKPTRILLVEDEPTLLELYEELLAAEGFEVVTADEGKRALKHLQKGGFDLVLLDIMIPNLDGFRVLAKLNAGPPPKLPNKSIVLLTNLAQDEVMQKAATSGVRGYLIKSNYNPLEFIQEVKKFLT